MLSEALQAVRKVYLEIESEDRVPTYSGDIITGDILIMRSLNDTVLRLNPLKVSYASIEWLFRVLRDANVMRAKVDELMRMAVIGEWSDKRLLNEYELRIAHSNEYEVLDARRRGELDAYFNGGRGALRATMTLLDGDLYWPYSKWPNADHSFTNTPNDNKDLLHAKAQANYHAHHNNALYEAAKASLGLDDSPYYNLVVNAMIDAAIFYSGSPYYSDDFFYSALKFLNIPFSDECAQWFVEFRKRMVI